MPKNYDSDFCGNLPLNFINSIQSYGALLVLDQHWKIIQVSENIDTLLNKSFSDVLGNTIDKIFSTEDQERILSRLSIKGNDKVPVTAHAKVQEEEVELLLLIHKVNNYILVEVEKQDKNEKFSFIYQEIKYIMAHLKNCETSQEFLQVSAKEIRRMSGFDRVMIYQFDHQWNGTVVAEDKEETLESYYGLRFPASDVPRQARALYLKNPYRFIPNRNYQPVKLQPLLNPISYGYTDLSEANLRSVAPVHLEYLKNMNVVSSMSTPIIKDGQLWGLISCHHKEEKLLNYEMRSAFELISNVISNQLSSKEGEKYLLHNSRLKDLQSSIYKNMISNLNYAEALLNKSPDVLSLLELDGVGIVYNGKVLTKGLVPPESLVRDILFWVKVNHSNNIYTTDAMLHNIGVSNEEQFDEISGLISIPIVPNRDEFILGFRKEFVQTVEWGGNPNEAIQLEKDNKTYHPRNSFSIWKEIVKSSSKPWETEIIEAAEKLRIGILEVIVRGEN